VSGFLRNLSAQALGQRAPVRSVARLPYAAALAALEPGSDASTAAVPPEMADRSAPSEPGIAHVIPPLLFSHTQRAVDDATCTPFLMRDPAEPEKATPTAAPSVQPSATMAVSTPPTLIAAAPQVPPSPAFASDAGARDAETGARRALAAPEATEVHVSIGRIELTAVHDAPMPTRRAAPVKPSVPLREYLARGQRRSS
jgi:hypothetical protein